MQTIYLDNNATTPLLHEVKEVVIEYLDKFANPSSIYQIAKENKKAVEKARQSAADMINANSKCITFTSCGSESNNMALRGVAKKLRNEGKHIISTVIEHPSVIETLKDLQKEGFEVDFLPVSQDGVVSVTDFKNAIKPTTILATVMLANNETGVIQPIKELTKIAHKHNIIFHTDAVQAIGKINVDVNELGVDLLSVSGHKLYAPKGIGLLYIKEETPMEPFITGGGQEFGRRAGTENVAYIAALGKACELTTRNLNQMSKIKSLRNSFETKLLELFPKGKINGTKAERLPNTISFALNEIVGEDLLLKLAEKGILFSSTAACKAGSKEPSYVLSAMGLSASMAHSTIRLSLGVQTLESDIANALHAFAEV